MPGRVLNFLEFSDKYSDGTNEPLSIDDFTNASTNFKEGFDDETYDQPQIKPNRPISGNYEMTPTISGEKGSSLFSEKNSDMMNAPEESTKDKVEDTEEDKEDGNTKDDKDDEEEGNPEAGLNPKKKIDESIISIKSFSSFINEEVDDLTLSNEEECQECGEVPIVNEYGSSCGCTM